MIMERMMGSFAHLLLLLLPLLLLVATTVAAEASRPPPNKLIAVKTNCTRDAFNVKLDLAKPFRGVIFAKDFLDECRTNGNQTATVVIAMATAGCGIRSEHRKDGTSELSVTLVMQMDGKLRQMSDIKQVVRCVLPANMMSIAVDVGDGGGGGGGQGGGGNGGGAEKAVKRGRSGQLPGGRRGSVVRGAGGGVNAIAVGGKRTEGVVQTSGLRNGRMKHYGTTANVHAPNRDFPAGDDYDQVADSSANPDDRTADSYSDAVELQQQDEQGGEQEEEEEQEEQEQEEVRTPRVRVWMELGGAGGAGAVEVGELTTFAVRAVLPGNIGVRVVDCAALDGIGETSQKLLDERGCPVDEQVMPALFTRLRPMEEGWSKPHADDLVEKLFTASFPAFKFPDRERLHLSCGVQLCKTACPEVDCSAAQPFVLGIDRHLARIEVFNSLTVTAPKIDLDRMRALSTAAGVGVNGAGMANVTVDEYPPRLRAAAVGGSAAAGGSGDGILCMSTSRLALAFCVLGLIFLVAVVVAVYCLLRAKTRRHGAVVDGRMIGCVGRVGGAVALVSAGAGGSGGLGRGVFDGRVHLRTATTTGSTSIFSSSSGSQSRFGSKLILAPGGSLPYGRVY